MRVSPALIHRLFYPQVPAVFSAAFEGRVSAMPVVSYAAVSSRPPVVAVSCSPSSFTYKLSIKAAKFSLSLLSRKHAKSMEFLASSSGRGVRDKLASAGLVHTKGTKLAVPVIQGAEATLECAVSKEQKVGDHVLVFGTVKASYATHAFAEGWDFGSYNPILYTGWRDGMTQYESR